MTVRLPTAPPAGAAPMARVRTRGNRGRRRGRIAILLGIVLGGLVLPGPAIEVLAKDAEEARGRALPGSKREYQAFVTAWTKRNASGVVSLVAPRGVVNLSLLSPRTRGSYQRAHAVRTLKSYFQNVSSIHLRDVTKPLTPLPRGYMVRTYDYTYAPRGRDRVTTQLVVTMRLHGGRTWMLDSIAERLRPAR